MENKYTKLKDKQSEEINNYHYMFFAFSEKQFNEGLARLGLTRSPEELKKIASLEMAGGYVLKEKAEELINLLESQFSQMEEFLNVRENLKEAFLYELGNHEYCITYDATDALGALGIDYNEIEKKFPGLFKETVREYLNYQDIIN